MKLNVHCGRFVCDTGNYTPTGSLRAHGHSRQNPAVPMGNKTISARIFVGLSVHDKPKWKAGDVIDVVTRLRKKQVGDPSSSFLSQIGVYQHQSDGKIVREKSVQVIIIKTHPGTQLQFTDMMKEIAENLAIRLQQEAVVLEVQVNGVTKSVWWVTPGPKSGVRSNPSARSGGRRQDASLAVAGDECVKLGLYSADTAIYNARFVGDLRKALEQLDRACDELSAAEVRAERGGLPSRAKRIGKVHERVAKVRAQLRGNK